MGYRSDVGIAMYTKDYNTMMRRAKALKNQDIYNFIDSADKYMSKEDAKITILTWDCVKWYSTFKEVSWIGNFIEKIPSAFIRVGEDLEDNEEQIFEDAYKLFDYIYLNRSIEVTNSIRQQKGEK